MNSHLPHELKHAVTMQYALKKKSTAKSRTETQSRQHVAQMQQESLKMDNAL